MEKIKSESGTFVAWLITLLLALLMLAFFFKVAWNASLVPLFKFPELAYGQAVALLVLWNIIRRPSNVKLKDPDADD